MEESSTQLSDDSSQEKMALSVDGQCSALLCSFTGIAQFNPKNIRTNLDINRYLLYRTNTKRSKDASKTALSSVGKQREAERNPK